MSYRSLFRRRYVIRLLTGSWIGRLPFDMAVVAIPLAVRRGIRLDSDALRRRHVGRGRRGRPRHRAGRPRQASLCGSLGVAARLAILLCGYPMLRIRRP